MNNRKRQIIQACMTLFVEKGFVETSIQDILTEASISKGTFYNYFSSKKDCLIAILENSRKEANMHKVTALTGKEKNDKSALVAQLTSTMRSSKEQNIVPIIESILHSEDRDVKYLVDQILLREINWTATRLLDVYGAKLVPYHHDAAIILFGLIHQFFHMNKLISGQKCDPEPVITFAMDQLDVIIPNLIEKKQTLIGPAFADYVSEHIDIATIEKQDVLEQLEGFKTFLKVITSEQQEFLDYLIEELRNDTPRYNITNVIAFQLHKSFRNTPHASEAIEIANHVWQLSKQKREKA